MIKGVAAVWLPVTDMDRAVAFYGETLGLSVTEHDDDWSEIDANGLRIGLNGSDTESPRGDGGALVAFQPDGDLEQEVERLKDEGVDFSDEISEHPWGRGVPVRIRTATISSSTHRHADQVRGQGRTVLTLRYSTPALCTPCLMRSAISPAGSALSARPEDSAIRASVSPRRPSSRRSALAGRT